MNAIPARRCRRSTLALVFVSLLLAIAVGGTVFAPVCLAGSGARTIALKLAPGTRLVYGEADTISVSRDWGSLSAASHELPGPPLRPAGTLKDLGIALLEPAESSTSPVEPAEIDHLLRQLRLTPGVLWAEAGIPLRACLVPNDPWYPAVGTSIGQWGFGRVGLPEAWDITTGSEAVTVAFLDTGLNRDIPDFAGRIVSPFSVLSDSAAWPAWQDNDGHGSAVAAVAVARGNDGVGIAGAAWNVGIMPVKISDKGESDTVILAEAIEHAVDSGADVINISFATPPGVSAGRTLTEAVKYALRKGVTVVAAAGNNGGSLSYPAALDGVIAVGATTLSDTRWTTSSYGSNTGQGLDVVAPGAGILSYFPLSTTSFSDDYAGTSLACPLVAGVVALMLSEDGSLAPATVNELLNSTAEDLGPRGWDAEYGAGIVDAEAAVRQAASHSSSSTTSTTTSTTTTTTTAPSKQFLDVSDETTPYWFEIGRLAGRGIVTGTADGLFRPGETLKRQQFAKMIVLSLSCPVSADSVCPFVDVIDVPGELYPYHFIAAAYAAGITNGTTPDHFSPYRTLTRAQLITMVARAAGLPEPPADYATSFPNFSSVHYPWARKAEYAGLLLRLVGMGYDYDFWLPATRGEACALLYPLVE